MSDSEPIAESGRVPVAVVRRIASDTDAPRIARNAAADILKRLRCGHERSDDLALVVSEMVTNAVVHGPDAELELALTGTPAMVRVEVRDAGTTHFEWPESPGNGHWGLGLVGIFSDRSGITRQPSTVVWCELDLAETA